MTIASPATKLEILVDEPLRKRIRTVAENLQLHGYTFHPVSGGADESGRWLADTVTGGAGSKTLFVIVLIPEEAENFLKALAPLIDEYRLVITATDVSVIRRKV